MPLGNMQKKSKNKNSFDLFYIYTFFFNFMILSTYFFLGTTSNIRRASVTPPKADPPHIVCSTPNANSNKKSKPAASSTPNASDTLKSQRILTEKHFNGQKSTSPHNASLMSPNSNFQRKGSTRRTNQRYCSSVL